MKTIIISLVLCYQVYAQCWVATYNGSANYRDVSQRIALDQYGNIYVTGFSTEIHGSDTNPDYCTIKYNSNGIQEWVRTYNGEDNDSDLGMTVTTDNYENIYITGKSYYQLTGRDIVTIKYNPQGEILWIRRFSGPYDDWASDMVCDANGNVYITGFTEEYYEERRSITIKYNTNGTQEWVRIDTIYSWTYSICLDSLNNIYVAGHQLPSGTGMGRFLTLKYNSNGILQWRAGQNITNYSDAYKLNVTPAGNVYVTGKLGPDYLWDILTVKYNTCGQEQWVRTYDSPYQAWEWGQSLVVDSDENVYVTGPSNTLPGMLASPDYVTIKYDSSGNEQWVRRYDAAGAEDCPFDIVVDNQNNIYVGGYSMGYYPPMWNDDVAIVKYDSSGNQIWVARYNNTAEWVYDLEIDDGYVYATGFYLNLGLSADKDYLTLKYPLSGPGIEEKLTIRKKIPNIKITPNPFQNRVRFDMPISQYPYQIKIYRIDGRIVKTFNNINSPYIYWDGKDDAGNILPSGVYFADVTNGYERLNKRLVIMK